MGDQLTDWQDPFRRWAAAIERNPPTRPEEPDLETITGLGEWLSHPSNWRKTELFIVGWDGLTPWISAGHVWKLAPDCNDRQGLLEVILYDRRRRKARPKAEEPEGTEE